MSIEQTAALSAAREQLRAASGLRPLSRSEEGAPLAAVPNGTYGFSTSAATSEIAVFSKPVFRSFELHKLASGEIRYVGYVCPAEERTLAGGSEPAVINLYPDPYDQATILVQVSASRIDRKRPPLRDLGSPMQLEIAAKLRRGESRGTS